MRNPHAVIVYLGIVMIFKVAASAAEPAAKPAKTRLLPRALPGGSPTPAGVEERLVKRPVTAGSQAVGAGGVHAGEKAHINVIRRGKENVQINGCAPSLPAGTNDVNSDRPKAPDSSELPPMRPGKIRVLPKSEIKTDAALRIAAQQVP